MGSKVEAAIRFHEGGGERVMIAHLNELMPALLGDESGELRPLLDSIDTIGHTSGRYRRD